MPCTALTCRWARHWYLSLAGLAPRPPDLPDLRLQMEFVWSDDEEPSESEKPSEEDGAAAQQLRPQEAAPGTSGDENDGATTNCSARGELRLVPPAPPQAHGAFRCTRVCCAWDLIAAAAPNRMVGVVCPGGAIAPAVD